MWTLTFFRLQQIKWPILDHFELLKQQGLIFPDFNIFIYNLRPFNKMSSKILDLIFYDSKSCTVKFIYRYTGEHKHWFHLLLLQKEKNTSLNKYLWNTYFKQGSIK